KSRSAVRKRDLDNEDGVLQEAKQDEKGQKQNKTQNKPQQKTDGVATPASIAGIEFKMLVDGKPAEVKKSDSQNAKYSIASPKSGQKVVFSLKNNDKQTLGVVLKLNGVSTIDQQK